MSTKQSKLLLGWLRRKALTSGGRGGEGRGGEGGKQYGQLEASAAAVADPSLYA
jgi:hypothetical protein